MLTGNNINITTFTVDILFRLQLLQALDLIAVFSRLFVVQLPGGGIDPGENPIDALHREVFEETGWKIGDIRKIGAYRRFCYMPEYDKWAEKLCHIYMARPVHRLGPPSEPDHTPLWMPMAEAARTIASPGDRAFVADLYSRSRFSTR